MKALVYSNNTLAMQEIVKPDIKNNDDVIVKVAQTGICGTDRSILVGKFAAKDGVVLGHESVGIVDSIGGKVAHLAVGDKVVVNPTMYCGTCENCMTGNVNFCVNKRGSEVGVDRDGAFAEYIRMPERFLHKLPSEMSLDKAVMIEPLACVMNNVSAGNVKAGEKVFIIGGGPMGALAAMYAAHIGASVVVVESDTYRLEKCNEIFQGEPRISVVSPSADNLHKAADVVIDSVGNQLEFSLGCLRARGRVVIFGYHNKYETTIKPLDILMNGYSIIGAGDYNSFVFPIAIKVAESIAIEKLITHSLPLASFKDAFGILSASGEKNYQALKVVLVP